MLPIKLKGRIILTISTDNELVNSKMRLRKQNSHVGAIIGTQTHTTFAWFDFLIISKKTCHLIFWNIWNFIEKLFAYHLVSPGLIWKARVLGRSLGHGMKGWKHHIRWRFWWSASKPYLFCHPTKPDGWRLFWNSNPVCLSTSTRKFFSSRASASPSLCWRDVEAPTLYSACLGALNSLACGAGGLSSWRR